jgi:O-antigen/teichoic acid export membrane protein
MFNAAGRLWEGVCNVVLTAYIVPRVGLSGWGLWALLSVFTGYLALFDLGVGSGFAKYIAEHAARKEDQAISRVVSSGFFFYLVLGLVLIAIGWPCIDGVIRLIAFLSPERMRAAAAPQFIEEIRFLLRWGLVLFAASNAAAAFASVQTGLQRMGITNAISFAASIIKVVATVAFLETGCGVRGLLYANGAVLAFFAATGIVVAFALTPGLRISPRCVDRATLGRLIAFGWRTQVSRLSNVVTFQTDKAIVWAYLGLNLVGVYRIGEEAATKMRQVPVLLLSALVPAASDLDARGDRERVRRLYLLSSKYVSVVTFPLVAFWVGASGLLIRTWMGPNVAELEIAAWVNRIIAFGYLANIVPGAGVSVALGVNRPDVQMKAGLIAMVSNIALTILLAIPFGIYGVALGTALSLFLACAWFLAAMREVVGVAAGELLRRSLVWPALASLPGFLVCGLADAWSGGLAGRIQNGEILLVCAAVFGISYLVLLRFTPCLDAFDIGFLADTLHLRRVPGFRLWARRAAPRV